MKPAPFEYIRPATLPEALAALAQDEDTTVLAGGQSLVPMMNTRLARPARLLDINRLPDLDHVRDEGSVIAIGPLARHADIMRDPLVVEHLPLVAEAYEWIAHSAVRNRGTLAGNLCHADPASEMPAILQVLGAELVLRSEADERRVPAEGFFLGAYETGRRPGELLVEIRIPKPAPGTGHGFEEVAMRKGDYAWAAAVATLRVEGGRIAQARIAVAGVETRAARLPEAEAALDGEAPDAALFAEVARAAADGVTPQGSASAGAEYRRDLVRSLLPRVLARAAQGGTT